MCRNLVINRGLLATLLLSIASVPTRTNSQSASPKITCRQPVYEFGAVDNSQSVEHTFVIWNEGEAPLEIRRVRACCGATAEIADKTILPRTNTTLRIKLSLHGRKGKQQKSFYVASNDPKQPYYQLRLTGTAVAMVDVRPRSVNFGQVSSDAIVSSDILVVPREIRLSEVDKKPITRYVAIRSRSKKPFKILKLKPPESEIGAKFTPLGSYGYRCELRNIMPFPEPNEKNIVITTDHEDAKEIVIPVRVASKKRVKASADDAFEIGADGTVKAGGIEFKNLVEYVKSDYFKKMGKRCLIKGRYKRKQLLASTSDCTLSQTVVQNEYWPSHTYTIPIVFHVISHTNGTGNVSDQRIYDQMAVLNEDFRAIFGSLGEPGFDTKIQFVLAGITRTENNTWHNDGDEYGYKSALGWDQDRYLNVYVNTASGYLGYVYLPQEYAGDVLDGVVILYECVGGRDNGYIEYDQGRTLVHEIGHYLGLLHTFEGGCGEGYTAGDLIADTHSEEDAHYGCTQTYTCGTPDDIHNYMNYTDDSCMYEFTTQQANRAVCGLVNYRPQLPQTTASMSGNCLDFDGTNDCVTIADHNQLDLTNNYTLEAWVYVHSFSSLGGIVSKYHAPSTNGFMLRLHWDAPYTGLGFDGMQTAMGLLESNRWYHVAAVNSNGTRLLYLNGSEQSLTGTAMTVQANTNPVCIGVDSLADAHYFGGKIDEVRIWNDVRTETEICDAMHKLVVADEAGLIAYYRFDHISGTNLYDFTTNNFDGTLVNMQSNDWIASTFPCANAVINRTSLRAAWDGQTNSLLSGRMSVADGDVVGTNFVVFGHNNADESHNIIDIPSGIEWRLKRVWQLEVEGALTGAVAIALDGLSDIGDGSALRLLTDTDGAFTNAAIVEGNVSNTTFTASDLALGDGPFMTLAKTGTVVVITASAGDHGNIEPVGKVYVVLGDSTNFAINPDSYYHVDDVTTNSISVGAVTSFTWSNVSANGTIHAAFAEDTAALATPHWWLAQYGLTNSGLSFDEAETNDADADLFDAHDEYVADTDPTNPVSYFCITAVSNLPPLTAYFQSSSNRQYTLKFNTNLVSGSWTNLPEQTGVAGVGGQDSMSDTNPLAGARFYRINVKLP